MSLRLPDHWPWDFWFAVDGEDVHVFFLHAPRSVGDPELRHRNARIGHAVSRDLHHWEPLPNPSVPTGSPSRRSCLAAPSARTTRAGYCGTTGGGISSCGEDTATRASSSAS